jgi:hypothetical protein
MIFDKSPGTDGGIISAVPVAHHAPAAWSAPLLSRGPLPRLSAFGPERSCLRRWSGSRFSSAARVVLIRCGPYLAAVGARPGPAHTERGKPHRTKEIGVSPSAVSSGLPQTEPEPPSLIGCSWMARERFRHPRRMSSQEICIAVNHFHRFRSRQWGANIPPRKVFLSATRSLF